ncbi:MAG TPA: hypothetical protein VHR45_07930 [Thermoanaerobaculia bacterium]|nr:hypothetical protein [Thermoanaerobaculia bacterium]
METTGLIESATPPAGAGTAGGRNGSAARSRRVRAGPALPGAMAAAIYTAAALVCLRPIWETYSNHIAPDPGDPVFSLYLLKWVVHQIRSGFPNLWDANCFFPTRGVLALADHVLGPAFQIAWMHNAIAGYNLLVFTSFVLCGLGVWWVLLRGGCSWPAALLAGAMYAFSPFRLGHLSHLLMLLMQWIPLTLWSFDRLLAERTVKRAALFLLFYVLHLTGGCYLAYMIHLPLLLILLSRAAAHRRQLLTPAALRVLLPVAALALAAAVAIFLPYVRTTRRLDLARDEREQMSNGAALASYFSPAPANLYSLHAPRQLFARGELARWQQPFVRSENSLFAGFLPTLLAAWGAAAFWRRHRARPAAPIAGWRRLALAALAAVAIASFALGDLYTLGLEEGTALESWSKPELFTPLGCLFLLALGLWLVLRRRFGGGGVLRWGDVDPWERAVALSGLLCFLLSFPLVYCPLMRVLPGLSGMRAPARFGAFVSFTVVFFAAQAMDDLAGRLRARSTRLRWPALVWVLTGAVLAIELAPRPVRWVRLLTEEEFPDVYAWIKGRPEIHALIELPLRPNWTETSYMYYSTLHWKPIANGFGSFIPRSYDELANQIRMLPDRQGLALLRRLGVSHIVVHLDDLAGRGSGADQAAPLLRDWERELAGTEVALVFADDPDRVYQILPPSAAQHSGP